jgi:hypothetical protein
LNLLPLPILPQLPDLTLGIVVIKVLDQDLLPSPLSLDGVQVLDLLDHMLILECLHVLKLRLIAVYDAIEDAVIKVFGIQLPVKVYDLDCLICTKHIQEAL